MKIKIFQFLRSEIPKEKIEEIFQGWNAYAKWANAFNLRLKIFREIVGLVK